MKQEFCNDIKDKIRDRPEELSQRDMRHIIRCRQCSAAFQQYVEAPLLRTVSDKGRLTTRPGFGRRLKEAFKTSPAKKARFDGFGWPLPFPRPVLAAAVMLILLLGWYNIQPQIKEWKIQRLRHQIEARLTEEASLPDRWPLLPALPPDEDLDDLIAGLRRLETESAPEGLFTVEPDEPRSHRENGFYLRPEPWKQKLFEESDPFLGDLEFISPGLNEDPYIFS